MARFTKVYETLWTSRRFINLSDFDRVAFLYVATCGHQTKVGVARIPGPYAAADLKRPETEFTESLARLEVAGLLARDQETNEVFVRQWFKHHPPANAKHAQGLRNLIEDVSSAAIRELARSEFSGCAWTAEAPTDTEKKSRRPRQASSDGFSGEIDF